VRLARLSLLSTSSVTPRASLPCIGWRVYSWSNRLHQLLDLPFATATGAIDFFLIRQGVDPISRNRGYQTETIAARHPAGGVIRLTPILAALDRHDAPYSPPVRSGASNRDTSRSLRHTESHQPFGLDDPGVSIRLIAEVGKDPWPPVRFRHLDAYAPVRLPDHQEFCFSHGASIGQTLRHTTNRRV
jgi:hypothetical protein